MIEPAPMTIAEFESYVATAPDGFIYELSAAGMLLAFATGTEEHGRLITRLTNWISAKDAGPCVTYGSTMALRKHPNFPPAVVPDVMTTCEASDGGRTFVVAPTLVVEVVSPNSVTNDLHTKPGVYGAITSIMEYLVVDSRVAWARLFRRDESGTLAAFGSDLTESSDRIELQTIGLTFTLAELYAGILRTWS